VATQNLGELGRGEGVPVFVEWRWYYNVPSWPLWVLLLLLAVGPKHNRNRQAWLILLLPLLAAGFSLLIRTLMPGSSQLDTFGQFITALAVAWACVWLVGPWLIRGDRIRTLLGACAVMFAVGAVGYLGYFGFWVSRNTTWATVGYWAACSVPLIAATALTGLCCRGNCSPLRLVFWPVLWMPVACASCISVLAVVMLVLEGGGGFFMLGNLVFVVMQGIVISGFVAGMLYVLDLPVILLRIFSPCYRERFRSVFSRHDSRIQMTDALGKPASESVGESPLRE
jgi:hypothetical protein